MTTVDTISFNFRMEDEMFARNLYVDWDRFCRHCVTDILEEFFAPYEDMETCLEIQDLELDLGNIPQEKFHEMFPVRFREALKKSFEALFSSRMDVWQFERLFFSESDWIWAGRYERQRLLSMIMEKSPEIVVEFIHISRDNDRLDFIAELLEDRHVRVIMATEAEGHAEIGVPEYWYRLYGWLLEYYPFNGVPMFGDKPHFRVHLNRSLLAFIHKRHSPVYLSKVDITMQFMQEVFGADYYLTVLDIIYHNQRLNEDGSPESGDSYIWELYNILLQLSLLRTVPISVKDALPESQPDEWVAWLSSPSVSDTEKSQLLRHYARWRPELLWKLVRYSTVSTPGRRHIAFAQWSEWLGVEDWLEMISGMSLSLGDALGRTVGTVSEKYGIEDKMLAEGLVRFVASCPIERIRCGNTSDIVKKYLENITSLCTGVEDRSEQKEPEYIEVPNAGLCLLAIWFTRLFGMLGLLEEKEDGKKDLKDTEARIRAIFILQRIVTGESREYKEQELAFNRILTGCPFYVPLPKTLTLTSQEIQTVESMLYGVKSNWDKLKNTSVNGFQHSFLERPGKLEQREDKWVLYVENRSYDILLDFLPWSYRQIRLPWLKKKIHVVWRDKEEFDFENYNN